MSAVEWTLDELVVAALAHGFDDDIRAFNGAASFVPVVALQLARATHAGPYLGRLLDRRRPAPTDDSAVDAV